MALERYWVPLEDVIEFKREVYKLALNELSTHLHHKIKPSPHTKVVVKQE